MILVLVGAVVVPAAVGGALLLADPRSEGIARRVALVVAALVLAATIAVAVQPPVPLTVLVPTAVLGVRAEGAALVLLPAVAAVALTVVLAARRQASSSRFHGLILLFVGAVLLTLVATTLPLLLAAWEVMGAVSFALIGLDRSDPEAAGGALTAFLTTRAADVGLYLAAGAAVAAGSGGGLEDLASLPEPWRSVVAGGIVVAAFGKAAQLPFSFWLSRAMLGPSPVSALLHSAAMVAMGGYLLLRVGPLLVATGWACSVVAWIGAATAVLLGVVALAHGDIKQVLAASTAAQLGLVVLAAGVGATAGGVAQLLAHAATKALLFLIAGLWLAGVGTRALAGLRGVARRDRLVGVLFTVGCASLAGLPPLSIWAAKDLVLATAGPGLLVAGVVASMLSAAYSARLLRIVWARPTFHGSGKPATDYRVPAAEHGEGPAARRARISLHTAAPLTMLAAAGIALGAVALPSVREAFGRTIGVDAPAPSLQLTAILTALTVAAFVLGLTRDLPAPAFARQWLGLEAAAHAMVVRPILRLAAATARVDDGLGRAVLGIGPATGAIASAALRADSALDRRVLGDGGRVRSVAGAALALGRVAQRPQTGRVHQYLAIGAIGTVVLVVLLLVVR